MSKPQPRYQRPERQQMQIDERSLDQTLTPDHVARVLWDFVDGLDLSALHDTVKAVEGRPGTPPIDPRILPFGAATVPESENSRSATPSAAMPPS